MDRQEAARIARQAARQLKDAKPGEYSDAQLSNIKKTADHFKELAR